VELLPVHHNVPESFLPDRGLTNYWGYNTIGYFAPHAGYSAAVRAGHPGGQVAEFKAMVDALHAVGIEVLLDVVFNHTAEGGPDGPTLCHRGLDDLAYYRQHPDDPRRYVDTTGCGNSIDAADPLALQLIMDSLRYWLTEMRVDGFRFDLAPTLARQSGSFNRVSAFLDLVSQDPSCRGASSWPSPGTSARPTVMPSAPSRCCGVSGTASTGIRCATSGAATKASWGSSPPASPDPRTCTATRGSDPPRRST
jgi:pullulanase/glycogen debranching enzyme